MLALFARRIGAKGFLTRGRAGLEGGAVGWAALPNNQNLAAAAVASCSSSGASSSAARCADATAPIFSRGFASGRGAHAAKARATAGAGAGNAKQQSTNTSKKKSKKADANNAPPLKDVMKKLVRKVHPDLFASGPAGASAENDESLKVLQCVLDAVGRCTLTP
jgi:hypothetical protein